MARLTLILAIAERDALFRLSRIEERDPRAQVRLILRRELQARGLLKSDAPAQNARSTDAERGAEGAKNVDAN